MSNGKGNNRGDKMNDHDSGKLESGAMSLDPQEMPIALQDKQFLDEFLDIVEKNLVDPNLDIDAIADKLYISRATFFRKVKEIAGVPPKQFIQFYRLNRAKQLLEKKAGNVSEVAGMVGFSDQSSFSRYFKKIFGISPKAYQHDYLKKSADESQGARFEKPESKGHQKRMILQVEFTLDELDREFISRVVATKSAHMFDFKGREGTPQRSEIMKQVEMLFNPPIALASNEALKHFTLQEIVKKMRKEMDKIRKDVR